MSCHWCGEHYGEDGRIFVRPEACVMDDHCARSVGLGCDLCPLVRYAYGWRPCPVCGRNYCEPPQPHPWVVLAQKMEREGKA